MVLAAGLCALYLAEIYTEPEIAEDRPLAIAAAVVFSATLAWRRRVPLLPPAAALGVIVLSNVAIPAFAETPPAAFLFGLVVAVYSAGAHTEGRSTIAAALLIGAAIPAAAIESGEPFTLTDVGFTAVIFAGPFVGGRILRHRRTRERALKGRAVELEREGRERERTAVAEERARIARELHDVVSHAVSVVLLQARGARRVLSHEEVEVREALDAIERSSGAALEEMRRLLGLLRQGDEELALAPQPSLSRIGDLAESVGRAGLPVELSIDGEVGSLPPGVDISAYRIVQEALTNALRHAGPTRARVLIRRTPADLEIEVIDDGAGAGHGDGSGHGLVGMRERVAVYGGQLRVGERPGGGYAVSARLPLGSER